MEKVDKQINALILKFLDKMGNEGLTIAFIEGLLYDWHLFPDRHHLMNVNIRYLINKHYIEPKNNHPIIDDAMKFRITPKGKALLKKEFIDANIDLEI